MLRRFSQNTSGAAAVEYALIIALVGAITMGAFKTIGGVISQKLYEMAATIQLDPADRPKTQ